MPSAGVFSETLQSITTAKLTELSKKRQLFEDQKQFLLNTASVEADQQKKLRILLDGVKQSFALKTAPRRRGRNNAYGHVVGSTKDQRLEVLVKNLERFLAQAQYDPSISSKLLTDWESSLMQHVHIQSLKYQYATLYGELVTEWLSSEKPPVPNEDTMDEDFEHIAREAQAKDEGRAEWERLVFEPLETDFRGITRYLQNLFGVGRQIPSLKALHILRKSVETFEYDISAPGQFNEEVLRWTINGLLASGLLSEEKRAAVKDFLISPVILVEVADVLNMRMAAIDTWSWDMEGLPVEQRRHVTGRHHIYIEEDLLQAIFLQFIGVKWGVFFKRAFTEFSNHEGAWTSLRQPISANEKNRRDWFLGPGSDVKKPSVQSKRQGLYKSIYFMSQLPDTEFDSQSSLEGEEEVDYDTRSMQQQQQQQQMAVLTNAVQAPPQYQRPTQIQRMQQASGRSIQTASKSARARSSGMGNSYAPGNALEYDSEDDDDKPNSPMETKQFLLHLLSTEILVNTRLHGDFTCVHSEFESWNPSLPHSSILAVLTFFGLSPKWLRFFKNFLAMPLKFMDNGFFSETRIRKRGAPGAHSLSVVCGETILFCLDYAVNQRTNGAQLYRMHDDFWIWSSSHQTVVKGWEAINEFSTVMGVSLNASKTGTVRIVKEAIAPGTGQTVLKTMNPILPEGEIRWGFLYLDPDSGRFVIDQAMIDKHIKDFQRQLQDKKSIFSWIQAWNTYAGRFFTSNFGKPANCFGREHVNSMLQSLERIQRSIFSDTTVVEYLKNAMGERFGITDIPDGYLYFPASLGGLELHNPFIGLVQLRDSVWEKPETALDDFLVAEQEAYRRAKLSFNNRQNYNYGQERKPPGDVDEFMPFEEFARYREEFSSTYIDNLHSIFEQLLEKPTAESVDVNKTDNIMLGNYPPLVGDYWRWVAQLYGPDMMERFGGLNIVDAGLLPIGMVNLFREGKVKFQG